MLAVWSRTSRGALRSLVLIQLRGTEDVKGHLITHINHTLLICQVLFQFFFFFFIIIVFRKYLINKTLNVSQHVPLIKPLNWYQSAVSKFFH